MHPRHLLPLTTAAALLALAAPAAAHSGHGHTTPQARAAALGIRPATSFQARFGTARPGASTSLSLRVTGDPPPAGTEMAPAVRQVVTLPAGTRLRLTQLPWCDATDEMLARDGVEAACPANTKVGTGRAEGVLNGAPVVFDLAVYAVRGRLFFAGQRDGASLKQGFNGTVKGRRLTLVVPTANGAVAPTLFRARIAAPRGRDWLRTPRTCPGSGNWRFDTTFTGLTAPEGGAPVGASQSLRATSRCRRR